MGSERNQKDRAIEMDKIRPDPEQPRQHFDEKGIEELAESIDRQGLLERILVRPVGGNEYMIVHGERRYRACRKLGWKEIPCRVKDLNEEETRDAQLVENLQRDNLSDMELAWDFEKRTERGQTQEEIAERIGKSRSFVAKRLSLLKLSEEEQEKVLKGELSYSAARELATADKERKEEILGEAEDLTAREIRDLKDSRGVPHDTSDNNVPHDTSDTSDGGIKSEVSRLDLRVWNLIRRQESVPRNELVSALEKDLEEVREG